MENMNNNINSNYERHYTERTNLKVYPTEFVSEDFFGELSTS